MRRDLPCCSPIILFGFAHHLECLSEMQASPVALGVRIPTVALHLTELFDTTVEQLYSIFTVKELVQKFSKSPAVLEAERGGKFQMFDGNISGEYVELVSSYMVS